METIYVQFDGMVYQQIVGIPMGTNYAPLLADLFLFCYERDFMSNLQKSKRFDFIDKDKKEEIWLSPMTKAPTPTEMSKGQSKKKHKQRHKKVRLNSGCGPSSTIPLDTLTIYSPLITLHLLNIFPIYMYIQGNFSWIKQILPTQKHLSWI